MAFDIGLLEESTLTKQLVQVIATSFYWNEYGKTVEGRVSTPQVVEATAEVMAAFNEIMGLVDSNTKQLLLNMECKMNDLAARENEEHFSDGFVMGYFFLKQLLESSDQVRA